VFFFHTLQTTNAGKPIKNSEDEGLSPSFSLKNKHEAHSCGWKLRFRWGEPKSPQPPPIMT